MSNPFLIETTPLFSDRRRFHNSVLLPAYTVANKITLYSFINSGMEIPPSSRAIKKTKNTIIDQFWSGIAILSVSSRNHLYNRKRDKIF